MRPGQSQLLTAALVGAVATVVGTLAAVFVGGWAAWLGWTPVLVLAVALGFFFRQEGSAWGKGLLIGLAVGLVISAGVCVPSFAAV